MSDMMGRIGGSTVLSALAANGADVFIKAIVAVGNATGGSQDAALTLQLYGLDGATAITSARQVVIRASTTQYDPITALSATLTYVTATVGSIIGSGAGWALVQTDATGAFACTARNSADETLYFAADMPAAGVSALSASCAVIGSNSDAATWSA